MAGIASHYFARGNTARGAHFLYGSAFNGLNCIYVLEGGPGTGKSTAIRTVADAMLEQGLHIQLFHSPLRPDDLDALIVTELQLGVVDGRVCEGISCEDANRIVRIDFGAAVDADRISDKADAIEEWKLQLVDSYSKAYDTFAAALRIHDEWEKFYIESMDFAKADDVAQELKERFFGADAKDKAAAVRHLFFGAATPKGAVDHIQNLTSGLKKRIFIKGRPGSGKSTMLKRIAAAAEKYGYDVDVYHCGFDPNSLDMLIFPELGTAIFDSTAPHEYFPSRDGDEILDMYERTMTPGTDEKYAAELSEIKARYSAAMKEATAYLCEAEAVDAKIRDVFTTASDFVAVDALVKQLHDSIGESIKSGSAVDTHA